MPAKKTGPKIRAKKTMAKKSVAQKVTARKTSAKKVVAKKATAKKSAKPLGRAAIPVRRTSTNSMHARRGDHIVIDSPSVGSPPREGEVLTVIVGEVSVSYRVKWSDGHETLISPLAGVARIVRA